MKRTLKWIGTILLALVLLVLIVGFVLYAKGNSVASRTYEVDEGSLIRSAPSDSASIERGRHLATTLICRDCHGENLAGKIAIDAPPFIAAPANLTRGEGGIARAYSVADLDRAIRYGVKKDGSAVFPMMPSKAYSNLSDDDFMSLTAYILSIPEVDNVLPKSKLKPLGRAIAGAGVWEYAAEVSTSARGVTAPPVGPTIAYGEYLTNITCRYCHGTDLNGGEELDPAAPIPPAIRGAGGWPIETFDKAVRGGVGPTGNELHEMMPSKYFAAFTDDELKALHEYFKSIL